MKSSPPRLRGTSPNSTEPRHPPIGRPRPRRLERNVGATRSDGAATLGGNRRWAAPSPRTVVAMTDDSNLAAAILVLLARVAALEDAVLELAAGRPQSCRRRPVP